MAQMEPRYVTASSVVSAGVLVLAGFFALPWLWVVAAALGVVFAVGWPALLGLPARKSTFAVIAVVAALTSFVVAHHLSDLLLRTRLGLALLVVALGVCAIFVVQLVRGPKQPFRLESTLGGAAAVLIASLGAAWVGMEGISNAHASLDFSWLALCSGISLVLTELIVGMGARFIRVPPSKQPAWDVSALDTAALADTQEPSSAASPPNVVGKGLTDAVGHGLADVAGNAKGRRIRPMPRFAVPALVIATVIATALTALNGHMPWYVGLAVAIVSSLIALAWRSLMLSARPDHGTALTEEGYAAPNDLTAPNGMRGPHEPSELRGLYEPSGLREPLGMRTNLWAKLSLGVAPVLLCGPVITTVLILTMR